MFLDFSLDSIYEKIIARIEVSYCGTYELKVLCDEGVTVQISITKSGRQVLKECLCRVLRLSKYISEFSGKRIVELSCGLGVAVKSTIEVEEWLNRF